MFWVLFSILFEDHSLHAQDRCLGQKQRLFPNSPSLKLRIIIINARLPSQLWVATLGRWVLMPSCRRPDSRAAAMCSADEFRGREGGEETVMRSHQHFTFSTHWQALDINTSLETRSQLVLIKTDWQILSWNQQFCFYFPHTKHLSIYLSASPHISVLINSP